MNRDAQIRRRPQALEGFFQVGFTRHYEANAIVAYAFRNGPIEDLHAGKSSPLLDDPALSRIIARR